jgi:hypothetical protein
MDHNASEDFAVLIDTWCSNSASLLNRAVKIYKEKNKDILLKKVLYIADMFSKGSNTTIFYSAFDALSTTRPDLAWWNVPITRKDNKIISINKVDVYSVWNFPDPDLTLVPYASKDKTLTLNQMLTANKSPEGNDIYRMLVISTLNAFTGIKNKINTISAENINISLYAELEENITPGRSLTSYNPKTSITIKKLEPGEENNLTSIKWTPPSKGKYRLQLKVDPDNTITESDEDNNLSNIVELYVVKNIIEGEKLYTVSPVDKK